MNGPRRADDAAREMIAAFRRGDQPRRGADARQLPGEHYFRHRDAFRWQPSRRCCRLPRARAEDSRDRR